MIRFYYIFLLILVSFSTQAQDEFDNRMELQRSLNQSLLDQNWDDALGYTNLILALEPENKDLLLNKGSLWQKLGQDDSARIYFEYALELDSNYRPALERLAVWHYNQSAVGANCAIQMPGNSESMAAWRLSNQRNAEKAVWYYERCLDLKPGDEESIKALMALYDHLSMQKRLDELGQ